MDQPTFEKAIAANPLDSTNHHAYADWLGENGYHDESQFRRAIAKWLDKGYHPTVSKDTVSIQSPWNTELYPNEVDKFAFRYEPYESNTASYSPYSRRQYKFTDPKPHHPVWTSSDNSGPGTGQSKDGKFTWKSWNDMETSFREGFGRGKRKKKQLQRIADAVKRMSRKTGA